MVGDQRALDGERRYTQDASGSGRMGVGFRGINGAKVPRAGGDARSLELPREKTRSFWH